MTIKKIRAFFRWFSQRCMSSFMREVVSQLAHTAEATGEKSCIPIAGNWISVSPADSRGMYYFEFRKDPEESEPEHILPCPRRKLASAKPGIPLHLIWAVTIINAVERRWGKK